jgi:RNA polymerase sigma factor (sigma-70 family)
MPTAPPPTASADDYALLRRFVESGSAEPFATLAGRHSDFVFATALRQTRSRELAEDVTQAVFIVLARRANSIRPGTSVAGFLHQTAVFAAKNALRAESRRRRHETTAAVEQTRLKEDSSGHPIETDPAAVAVDRALLRLRGQDRQLLMLHYFDGFTMAEAAAALAISQEAARKRLHRALTRLRELLSHDGGAALAEAAVPAALLTIAKASAGVKAASAAVASIAIAGGVNGAAFTLAHQVLRIMKITTVTKVAAAAAAVVIITGSASVAVYKATRPPAPRQVAVAVPTPPPAPHAIIITKGPVVDPPDTTHIVDYARVFNQAPVVMDLRAKLERDRQAAQVEMPKSLKELSDLKAERDLLKPGSPQFQQADEKYKAAAKAFEQATRAKQDERAREAARDMLLVFQQMERAIAEVAAEEKIALPAAPGPYPEKVETMSMDAVRQYVNTRRLARPPGAPDLTDKVIAKLQNLPPKPSSVPASR